MLAGFAETSDVQRTPLVDDFCSDPFDQTTDVQPTKNSGRRLGLLFLASVLSGAAGTAFRGLSGADSDPFAFLSNVFEHASQMQIAIHLDMLASAISVAIALYVLPLLMQYSRRLAVIYVAVACINFTIITVSNVAHIALLSVGADFATSDSGSIHYTTLAVMLFDTYYWAHFLTLLLHGVGGVVLFYVFFGTLLLPRWLTVWGLLSLATVITGGALGMADVAAPFLLFMQHGLFMLVLIGWLLAAGFRPMRLPSRAHRSA